LDFGPCGFEPHPRHSQWSQNGHGRRLVTNEEIDPVKALKDLKAFLAGFEEYGDALGRACSPASRGLAENARDRLELQEPRITHLLVAIHGEGSYRAGIIGTCTTSSLLANALMDTGYSTWSDFVGSAIRRAIGKIEAGLWPPKSPRPILVIHDAVLRERCAALLAGPGKYDIVLREATTVLEDRIRSKVGHQALARALPAAADQTGDSLINKVFSVNNPILSISGEKGKQLAFRRMLLGVNGHIRNPYHHRLDDHTLWSWAWSVVGLVDRLLSEVDGCAIRTES
jgi:hypothetical protein